MKINTNVSSLTAQEAATNTNRSIASSLEKLSTGLKINKASDDASGLAIAVESAVRNLMTQSTNIKAAESVIRDVDYAEESANFNKLNIISQAGSYAISQSNATQQNVLRLLQ